MKKLSGFTLVEMVVVLAVVAILAAILTPTIAKNINDAKLARAVNETQVIGAAIGSFFKDVGRWPTSDGAAAALPDTVELLFGPGDVPIDPGNATDEENWLSVGATWTELDTFNNQLLENDPGDDANDYSTATTSELRWSGPYLTEFKADPWGSHYSCNILYTYNTATLNMVGVWSAGPNRIADTPATQAATAYAIGGDDILFRLQ
jgi:prepilin-type N-terminal cleavage/methylation domain-containing protein